MAEGEKSIAAGIKQECQLALNEATPLFERAIKALRTLQPKDFSVMKTFSNPPSGVVLALEACCVMLGVKPKMKKIDGVKRLDYWDISKKELLTNYKKLLDNLENYPKENIDPVIRSKI